MCLTNRVELPLLPKAAASRVTLLNIHTYCCLSFWDFLMEANLLNLSCWSPFTWDFINVIEHILMCFSVISIALVKCLFKSLAYFSTGLFIEFWEFFTYFAQKSIFRHTVCNFLPVCGLWLDFLKCLLKSRSFWFWWSLSSFYYLGCALHIKKNL